MTTSFCQRLRSGELLLGTMVTLPDPAIAELLALIGFDWLFIDGEHGPVETADLRHILAATGEKTASLVRIPSHDEVQIKKALDLGATGIIAPQVCTAEQAAAIVAHCRYPPLGTRGIGLARAQGYGTCFSDYVENANLDIAVVVQAEHRTAVENIDLIAAVPGIDCVLIGPSDLSASYGKLGKTGDPEIVRAMERICEACKQNHVAIGVFGTEAVDVLPWIANGCTLVVAGIDALLLGSAAKRLLDELRSRP